MISKWLSVEQAASALGVSPSTVRRRISGNLVEWRQSDSNRREVKIYFEEGTEDQPGLGLILEVSQTPIEQRPSQAPTQRMRAVARDAKPQEEASDENELVADASPAETILGGHKYSPLPSEAVGTPDNDEEPWDEIPQGQTEAERWPMGKPGFLKPSHLLNDQEEEDDVTPEAQARRFQKLAGASVLLAQRQADEANEKIAILHNHIYRMRQMCYLAWASAAVIAVTSISAIAFSSGGSGPAPAMAAPVTTVNQPLDIQQGDAQQYDSQDAQAMGMMPADFQPITARTDIDQIMEMDSPSRNSQELQDENQDLRDQIQLMQGKMQQMEAKSAKARAALQKALEEDINMNY